MMYETRRIGLPLLIPALALGLFACGTATEERTSPFAGLTPGGKGDMLKQSQIIDDINLNSTIDGKFNDRTRVYGFTVEAKAGATLTIAVTTRAGQKSSDVTPGKPLDTVIGAYGPMTESSKGAELALVDDAGEDLAAQLPPLTLESDGRYLVVLSSWNDPGDGSYQIRVSCAGTDFQCRRPVVSAPCTPGTRYITGNQVIGSEQWADCEVVLVEEVAVAEDAILTIKPGVTVKGNYVGTGPFGTVGLVVNGKLQAVGTEKHPVVFTALKDGWKGLTLKGSSNTLDHVYVERAHTGIALRGSANTITNVNINSGDTGLSFAAGSVENKVQRVRVTQVRDGVHLAGSAEIADSVFLGEQGDASKQGSGIWGDGGAPLSRVSRSLFSGFTHGMYLNSTEIEVLDATITQNGRGVFVTGANSGVHPSYTCPTFPQAPPPPPIRPAPPATWGRDPIFIRCDIIKNAEYGVMITAPELLVIEESNVRDNGAGIIIQSDSLHDDSRITRSNIHGNGTAAQVDSYHVNGMLDISANYWAQLSDPELSASWLMTHSQGMTCSNHNSPHNNCTYLNGNSYTCGAYSCNRSGSTWTCTAGVTASWNGQFTFTGFSPMPLQAGPQLVSSSDLVQKERQQQGL